MHSVLYTSSLSLSLFFFSFISFSLVSSLAHTRDRIFTALNYTCLKLQPLVQPAVSTEVLSQAPVCVIRYHLVGGVRVPNRPVTRLSRPPAFPTKERLSRGAYSRRKREHESKRRSRKKSKGSAKELATERVSDVVFQTFRSVCYFRKSIPTRVSANTVDSEDESHPPRRGRAAARG